MEDGSDELKKLLKMLIMHHIMGIGQSINAAMIGLEVYKHVSLVEWKEPPPKKKRKTIDWFGINHGMSIERTDCKNTIMKQCVCVCVRACQRGQRQQCLHF